MVEAQPSIATDGLWTHPFVALNMRKALAVHQKYFVNAMWCDGLITNMALNERGYSVSSAWSFCGELDTPHHRAWLCPHGQEEGQKIVPANFLKETQASLHSPLFTRGWLPRPSFLAQPPPEQVERFFEFDAEGRRSETGFVKLSAGALGLFVDGSCLHPSDPDLARAGFAVAELRPCGAPLRCVEDGSTFSVASPLEETAEAP